MFILSPTRRRWLWIALVGMLVIVCSCLLIYYFNNPNLQQTLVPMFIPTKQVSQATIQQSESWKVTEIEPLARIYNNQAYDTATFVSTTSGQRIVARCAFPDWPRPKIGDLFKENQSNVLVPENEDSGNPTQRFVDIVYLK